MTDMHHGLTEELLADLAFEQRPLPPSASQHLQECLQCRATYEEYLRVTGALALLPRQATTVPAVWPRIEEAMHANSAPRPAVQRRPQMIVRWLVAAGIVVLAFSLGRASAREQPGQSSRPREAPAGSAAAGDSLSAAESIQDAGTRYLTALSMLGEPGASAPARRQGREAAIATLYGATLELTRQGRGSANLASVGTLLEKERSEPAPSASLTTATQRN